MFNKIELLAGSFKIGLKLYLENLKVLVSILKKKMEENCILVRTTLIFMVFDVLKSFLWLYLNIF